MSDAGRWKSIYYKMLLTRFLEEGLTREAGAGNTYGPLHLCIGQEAAGVAACSALAPEDVITTTHRGHAHYLGRNLNLKRLCCEIFGKKEGYGKGRAGHMIVFDRSTGVLGGSGIVAGGLPMAVGQALAFHLQGEKRIVGAFFGDGASNTGSFHESLNMASKWKLPVLFFCENNNYGLTVHVKDHLSVQQVSVRAASYGIEGETIFGNDFMDVYETVKTAADKIRNGGGPVLIEAQTYRMCGFSTGDGGGYQLPEEMDEWKAKDPLEIAEKKMAEQGMADSGEISSLRKKALDEVNGALEYAKTAQGPDPVVVPDDVYEGAIQ